MLLELMFLVFLGSFILIFSFVNVTSSVWLVIILLSNIFEYLVFYWLCQRYRRKNVQENLTHLLTNAQPSLVIQNFL